jgi:RimJ/RimL family protein N-acetyltransferase
VKDYQIVEMNEAYANMIVNWKYENEYSIYSMNNNKDTLDEFLNGSYNVLLMNDEVIGYYCFGFSALVPSGIKQNVYQDEGYLDFGLGKNPRYCGNGNGLEFVKIGLDYLKAKFNTNKFRLTVYDFNKRAIKVYEKAGFKAKYAFKINEKANNYFIVMLLN